MILCPARAQSSIPPQNQHWAAHYSGTSYVRPGADYKTYQTAYRYGWEACQRYPGRSFDAVEPKLKRMWDKYRHAWSQTWEKPRLQPATPGIGWSAPYPATRTATEGSREAEQPAAS